MLDLGTGAERRLRAALPGPIAAPDATTGFTLLATDAPVVGALHGAASDLLLAYWRRIPVESLDVTGDAAAVTAAIAAADLG